MDQGLTGAADDGTTCGWRGAIGSAAGQWLRT
jgi:hypothetical protein